MPLETAECRPGVISCDLRKPRMSAANYGRRVLLDASGNSTIGASRVLPCKPASNAARSRNSGMQAMLACGRRTGHLFPGDGAENLGQRRDAEASNRGWLMCACGGSSPGHDEQDPAGGPGCGMQYRECSNCGYVEERHVTEALFLTPNEVPALARLEPAGDATDHDFGRPGKE